MDSLYLTILIRVSQDVFHPSSVVVTPVLWIYWGDSSNIYPICFWRHSVMVLLLHPMEGCSRVPQFYLRKSVFSGLDLRSFSWITRNHGLAGSHLLTATTAWCVHPVSHKWLTTSSRCELWVANSRRVHSKLTVWAHLVSLLWWMNSFKIYELAMSFQVSSQCVSYKLKFFTGIWQLGRFG